MQLPRTLRKGLLSLVFGTMVAQGLFPAAEAQAQTRPAAGASAADDTLTAASGDLEAMRQYYQRRAGNDVIIGAIDTDRLFVQSPSSEDNDLLRASIIAGGHTPDDASLARIAERVDAIPGRYTPNTGINLGHNTMAPVAVSNLLTTEGSDMCVVVSSQPDFTTIAPEGLSVVQSARFINRHEFYHCMHNDLPELHRQQQTVLAQSANSAAAFDFAASALREETRADLGAVMDMIALDGDDIGIIYAISSWRARRFVSAQNDFAHYSSPVLDALATEIQEMGIARFRDMNDRQRARMADRLMEDHSLSGGVLALVMTARLNVDSSHLTYPVSSGDYRAAAPIIAYIAANRGVRHIDMMPLLLSPAQVQELNSWDVTAELSRRAGTNGGDMTMLGLLGARADMLDDLRAALRSDPANPIHGARIIMVHNATQNLLADIAEPAEPTMAAYAPPTPPATRPQP